MIVNPNYAPSITGWSFALAKGLDSYGINSAEVFSDAGVKLSEIERNFRESGAMLVPVQ